MSINHQCGEFIHVPETTFRFKYTIVTPNRQVHDPIIEIPSQNFAQEDRSLDQHRNAIQKHIGIVLTMGVPYIPAVSNWLKPYPWGGFICTNTSSVTYGSRSQYALHVLGTKQLYIYPDAESKQKSLKGAINKSPGLFETGPYLKT